MGLGFWTDVAHAREEGDVDAGMCVDRDIHHRSRRPWMRPSCTPAGLVSVTLLGDSLKLCPSRLGPEDTEKLSTSQTGLHRVAVKSPKKLTPRSVLLLIPQKGIIPRTGDTTSIGARR